MGGRSIRKGKRGERVLASSAPVRPPGEAAKAASGRRDRCGVGGGRGDGGGGGRACTADTAGTAQRQGGALSCALGGDLGGLLPLLLSRPDDGGGSGSCGTGDWGGRRWQRARWGVVPTGGLIAAPAGWSGGWQQSVSGPHLDGGRHPRGSVGATATGATAVAAALPAAIRAVATAAGRRLGRPPPCQHWQWQWP